ncbi:MAG TPA: TonB-dependent receptor, partial [Niastella sp.]
QGRVLDTAGKALPFSTVRIPELDIQTTSATNGNFTIFVPNNIKRFQLEISHIGKETVTRTVSPGVSLTYTLRDKSLTLAEVEVSVTRKGGATPSSILFNRETIEQIQAFSIADVLNYLPGKVMAPPSLQNPNTLTLRTNIQQDYADHAMTNSLGAAIIMDGVRLSNDANMQGRSLSVWGMAGSVISGPTINNKDTKSFDVPYNGVDLRDIPVDNIESIEVIQGVAPAQYGELTSGAVLITRQAGKARWQLNTRINNGSTEFSLTKGFGLPKKWGALNITLSYLNSNDNPTDKIKSYNRVSTGFMWTKYFGKIKNTLSVDYNTKLDDVKQDPDDDRWRIVYSKSHNISISNRTSITFRNSFFDQANIRLSYSRGYQDTYNQYLMNQLPKGMGNKDTTGIYEGFFLPGAYLAEERVKGKPINISGTINTSATFTTGIVAHLLTAGIDMSYADNKGEGIVVDPLHPRYVNNNAQNERPYNYATMVPALVSTGLYLQNNMSLPAGSSRMKIATGVRYNIQNGYGNLQPRINISYPLSKGWELTAGYGISTKSPTLAHRYPAPAWLDIPILSLYTGQPGENLYLVYTQKIVSDNSDLKPAISSQLETGVRYSAKWINTSLFGYAKRDRNGFNSYQRFTPLVLPEYAYSYTAGQPIKYYPTGNMTTYAAFGINVITNGLESDNYGLEWVTQIQKIRAIKTSFTVSHAFSYSRFKEGSDPIMKPVNDSWINAGSKALYGVYKPAEGYNWSVMSKVNSDTHIPGLGFVISVSADIFWTRTKYAYEYTQIPLGYIDRDLRYVAIEKYDPTNTDYNYLELGENKTNTYNYRRIYATFGMRLAKEIQQRLRVTLSVYNFINSQTEHYNSNDQTSTKLRDPINITAGINLKF